jgi:histidinol-phosphate aminotransferase
MKTLFRKNILKLKPYQPGKPIDEVKRELGLRDVIKLASNENPLGPAPAAVSAIRRSLADINRYPDGNCFYLKKALSKSLRLSPSNIIIGNGSDEILDIIVKTFLNEDEEAITSKTTFLEYEIISQENGRRIRTVPLVDFKYNLEAIKKAIGPRTKLIFIANPNNPTGTYVNNREVNDFLKDIPKDLVVVFDEAYFEFVDARDFPQTLKLIEKRNIIILRTFSKIYGLAGLRVGFGVARESFIAAMERVRQPFNVNSLAQVAALGALNDPGFVKKTRNLILREKRFLYQALDEMGIGYIPTVANFIFIDLKKDALTIFKKMLKQGVIVRDMRPYGLKNYIRVTVGTHKENVRFIKVLKKTL